MNNQLDQMLAGLKKMESGSDRLKHLESDVWAQIVAQKADQPVGFLEGFLAFLFPKQHRFAPVMVAAMFGVFIGLGTMKSPVPDAAEMLNFKVFKPKVIALASITPNYERL